MGDEWSGVDLGTVDAGENHEETPENQAFGRAINGAQVEDVGMIGFPGGEEHGKGREQRGEGPEGSGTLTESSGLQQGG